MNKKRILISAGSGLLAIVVLYAILAIEIPAVKARTIFFAVWLAAEIYLWLTIQSAYSLFQNFKTKTLCRKMGELSFALIYWLPFLLVAICMVVLSQKGIKNMDSTTYLTVIGLSVIQYFIKFILTGLLVLWQIALKLVNQSKEFYRKNIRKSLSVLACFYAVALLLTFYGVVYGASNFTVKNCELETGNAVLQNDPLRIVLISDLHLAVWRNQEDLKEALAIVNAQNPDVIMVTGDLVQFEGSEITKHLSVLQSLKAPLGIYSVLGNHDYGRYAQFNSEAEREENVEMLVRNQESLGWKVLRNENVQLCLRDSAFTLNISGIEHWSADEMFVNDADIESAMQGIEDADYSILLSHNPQTWAAEVLPNYPINLTLSGHTHGMQLGIYTENCRFSPAKLLYKHWGGLYEDEQYPEKKLYVNVGLGSVGFPVRVGVYPEITVIDLK